MSAKYASLLPLVLVVSISIPVRAESKKQVRTPTEVESLSQRINENRGSVVRVVANFGNRAEYSGSGFIVNKTGIVVTANHVINPPGITLKRQAVFVDLPVPAGPIGGEGVELTNFTGVEATVLDTDDVHDSAVLKADGIMNRKGMSIEIQEGTHTKTIERNPKTSVAVLESRHLEDGEPVFVSGYPLEMGIMITTSGFIASSAPVSSEKTSEGWRLDDAYWADMQANPGNSGGPVFSLRSGKVIGIQVSTEMTAAIFLQPDEPVLLQRIGRDGKVIGAQQIYYNAGIARVIAASHVSDLLKKNKITF